MTLQAPTATPETVRETEPRCGWKLPVDFPRDVLSSACDSFENNKRIIDASLALLGQGEDLLHTLSDESYTRKVPVAFNAAIGGHYRHCLDHFASFTRALDADTVDYDHRERDVRLEQDRFFALDVTSQLRRTLRQLPPELLSQQVRVRCEISYAHGDAPLAMASLGRELVYGIAHAIHHFALISVMARLMEIELPAHFGVAPSTVAHAQQHTH